MTILVFKLVQCFHHLLSCVLQSISDFTRYLKQGSEAPLTIATISEEVEDDIEEEHQEAEKCKDRVGIHSNPGQCKY